jgi:4-hydroxybenzoate polyprenyltransferase
MACCAAASLFLYMAGLITNDLFDLEEDRRERPGRPIASGRIRPKPAAIVATVFFAAGLGWAGLAGFTSLLLAGTLTALILAYNSGAKRVSVWGPINMGLCRGLSLLIGAAAFGPMAPREPLVLVAAGGLTLYVASVTLIAAKETSGKAPGKLAWLPCWIVPLWMVVLGETAMLGNSLTHVVAVVIAVAAAVWVWRWSMLTQRATRPEAVSLGVGRFLQGLMLLQASLAAMAMSIGIWVSLGLVLLMPASVLVGRRFYAS